MGRELIELACGCVIDPCACGDTYHRDFRTHCTEAQEIFDVLNDDENDSSGVVWEVYWQAYVKHFGDNW